MYRFVVLSVVILTVSADPMDKRRCRRMFYPNAMRCCKNNSDSIYKLIISDDISECFELSKDPVSCERDTCIAKMKGVATDDNKIDKKKLEERMTKNFGSDAALLADVKSKCLNGDFDKYAPSEFCDFVKMRYCVSMQMLNHCHGWNENAECQEIKVLVAECVKIIT